MNKKAKEKNRVQRSILWTLSLLQYETNKQKNTIENHQDYY